MAEPRIIEFEGPDSLLEASNELLYGPPDIQAAIIHRAGSAAMYAACRTAHSMVLATRVAQEGLPQLWALEHCLDDWIDERLPDYCQLGRFSAFRASGSIGLHIDNPIDDYFYSSPAPAQCSFDGPLTFSYRAGDRPLLPNKASPATRQFYVQRTTASQLTDDGFDYDTDERIRADLRRRNHQDNPTRGMFQIDQEPDDLVLFLNYPTPTLHAVKEIEKATGQAFDLATSRDPDYPTALYALVGTWGITASLPR